MSSSSSSVAKFAFATLLALSVLASFASCQEESEADKEEFMRRREEQMQKLNEAFAPGNVELYAYFPKNQDHTFPVGELSTVVAGARIKEELYGRFSCYGVDAKITSPFDTSAVIQNFTYYEPFHTVMQGKDKSLHLKIMPARELQARKFQVIVQVQCSYLFDPPESPTEFDKGISYLNVAFNETCEFVDTTTAFDMDFFVLISLFGAMTFGMLYIFTDVFKSAGSGQAAQKAAPRKAKKMETGTVDANGEEWLEGTYAAKPKNKKKK